jgi:Coenzyme PQQ synthesis protein D (PqqD)
MTEPPTAPPLALETRVVQAAGVLAAPSDKDELLLIREDTSACFVLRGSGSAIWEAARRPARVADLCEALLRLYAVDRATCEREVLRTVGELLDQGLLECPG